MAPSDLELKQQLHAALLDGFPTRKGLERALFFKLNVQLNHIAADAINLDKTMDALINTADREDWLAALVAAAHLENPLNTGLKTLYDQIAEQIQAIYGGESSDDARAEALAAYVGARRIVRFTQNVVPLTAPGLPGQYVERSRELAALRKRILPQGPGEPPPQPITIMHGMGGAGKTVLAAAFARLPEVWRAFPDGVIWVTLGKDPDLAQALTVWGSALDDPNVATAAYPNAQTGTARLINMLQDKRCLLIVDDAWDKAHVAAFRAGGPECALLVTGHRREAAPDADGVLLEGMSEEEALALMAGWSGAIADGDREDAVWLAREVGFLPLALELIGAQVERMRSWPRFRERWDEQKLEALKRGRRPDSAQDSLLLSLEMSIDGLAQEDRDLYPVLAVFGEDAHFPIAPTALLWDLSMWDAEDLLDEYVRQALLKQIGTEQTVYGITVSAEKKYSAHDLLYDFMVMKLGGSGIAAAHIRLVDAYRARCDGRWHELEPDGYIHDRLAFHLKEAGLYDELIALIDAPWRQAQYERTSGHAAFARDLDIAVAAAGARDPVDWGELTRLTIIKAEITSLSVSLPPRLIGALACGYALERAMGYAALLPDPLQRSSAFRLIAMAIQHDGELTMSDSEKQRAMLAQARLAARAGGADSGKSTLSAIAHGLTLTAYAHLRSGDRDGGLRVMAEAAATALQISDMWLRVEMLDAIARTLLVAGEQDEAQRRAREALTIAQAITSWQREKEIEERLPLLALLGDDEGVLEGLQALDRDADEPVEEADNVALLPFTIPWGDLADAIEDIDRLWQADYRGWVVASLQTLADATASELQLIDHQTAQLAQNDAAAQWTALRDALDKRLADDAVEFGSPGRALLEALREMAAQLGGQADDTALHKALDGMTIAWVRLWEGRAAVDRGREFSMARRATAKALEDGVRWRQPEEPAPPIIPPSPDAAQISQARDQLNTAMNDGSMLHSDRLDVVKQCARVLVQTNESDDLANLVAFADSNPNSYFRVSGLATVAHALSEAGAAEAARDVAGKALDAAEADLSGRSEGDRAANDALLTMLTALADAPLARRALAQAQRFPIITAHTRNAKPLAQIAFALLRAGDEQSAAEAFTMLEAELRIMEHDFWRYDVLRELIDALTRHGDAPQLGRLIDTVVLVQLPIQRARLLIQIASGVADSGDSAVVVRAVEGARQALVDVANTSDRSEALAEIAEVQWRAGDRTGAAANTQRALVSAAQAGLMALLYVLAVTAPVLHAVTDEPTRAALIGRVADL